MRKMLNVLTPENVHVEYELAGLGSRFIAMFIDMLVQAGMMLLIVLCMVLGGIDLRNLQTTSSVVVALGIILLFVIFFGYFIFFEMIMGGQTPGKRAVKLRVIKQTGAPVGFIDSFLRNILRIADFLPSLYIAGMLFIMFSKYYKRIGDFAADTIVVKVRGEEQPVTVYDLLNSSVIADENERAVNIYPVNNFEYEVLKEFLARMEELGTRKPVFTYHLNRYFMKKFNMEKPYGDPYEFFETIIKANSGM